MARYSSNNRNFSLQEAGPTSTHLHFAKATYVSPAMQHRLSHLSKEPAQDKPSKTRSSLQQCWANASNQAMFRRPLKFMMLFGGRGGKTSRNRVVGLERCSLAKTQMSVWTWRRWQQSWKLGVPIYMSMISSLRGTMLSGGW